MLPFGHSLLELSEQVSVEFIELGEVVQDLVQDPLFNHRLSALTRRLGRHVTEVLRVRRQSRQMKRPFVTDG